MQPLLSILSALVCFHAVRDEKEGMKSELQNDPRAHGPRRAMLQRRDCSAPTTKISALVPERRDRGEYHIGIVKKAMKVYLGCF